MAEYIEREKLLELYADGKYDTADYHVPVPVIIQNIKDIPAADVRPVVRGKWIKTNEQECEMFTRVTWKCSVCGIEVISTEPVYRIDDWYFCPNCGADMMEEADG